MQIGSDVVCAFSSNFTGIHTGGTYKVIDMRYDEQHKEHYITFKDDVGAMVTYKQSRFMLLSEVGAMNVD